ncbi:MAG: hypothetical protein E7477_04110 [Ruminococcaceae bacterium]|nr:hypothetical protein [Oscillospiraceae bacterium]
MSKSFNFRAAFSKFLVPLAVIIFVLFSFSVTSSAEITSVEFVMEEEPVFIDEKTTEGIVEFYENATRAELFSSETNTFVKRKIKLEEKKPLVEKNAVVHTFKVTDIDYVDTDNVSEFVSDIVENIFIELTSNLGKKYVSTLIYMYGASYEVSYNPETGDVTEMLLHIALVVGDDFDQVDNLIETIIKPKADEWREYPAAKQIIELNNYLLDGYFTYDVKGVQRKSTVQFVANGKGVCEEYAGLTALFLDELGFENMLVRGYAVVDKENVEHVWNLVNVDGNWYHLDILWNGPIDETGAHTDITADYMLKSAKTIKKDHLTLAVYYSDSEKATTDYDLSEYIYNGDIVTPQMKLDMARESLAVVIDEAFDVCFRFSSKYTIDSVNRMMPVYTAAKKLYDDETATVEQIDAETEKVKDALEKYVVVFVEADKSKLYKSLSQAYQCMLYDFALYTSESVKALSEPYEAAVAVYQNKYATQKEVDSARSNLKKYLNKLEKIVVEEPEVEVVPDTETQIPDTTIPVTPDNNTEPPVIVTPITPLPDETVPDVGQKDPEESPEEENKTEEDVETDEIGETPADSETPEETPDGDVSEETGSPSDENIQTEEPDTEELPENNEPENDNNEESNENKPVDVVVTPKEPSGIDSDLIIYIVGALIALCGIVYLVVSKIRSNGEEEEEDSEQENTEETSSEENTETVELADEMKDAEESAETVVAAVAAVEEKSEEKTEETKEDDSSSEEKTEDKHEETSEENENTEDVKTENVETEAPAETETSDKKEEVKEQEEEVKAEVEEAVVAAAEVNSDEKDSEKTAEEEKSEEKTEETKEYESSSEEKTEDKHEETSEENENTEDVKTENVETEAPAETETSDKKEEVKEQEEEVKAEVAETVVAAAEAISDEKDSEKTAEEEKSEEKSETEEKKVEEEKTDPAAETEEPSEKKEDDAENNEASSETDEEKSAETVNSEPVPEEKPEAADEKTDIKPEELSPVEEKNQEKASRLLKYFSAKNEKLKKKEKADKE